ncbi:MAG: sulfotransferase [Phycisphaerales bacterium]|nr:sulfotransferase [Phycisphaerales bacterium]
MPQPPDVTQAFRAWQEQSRLLERVQIGFIVGPPKTGTSWVTSTLHAHPNAVARGEGHLPTRLIPALGQAMQAYHNAQAGGPRQKDKPPAAWLTPDPSDTLLLARQACDRVFVRYLATLKPGAKERIMALLDKTPDNARHMDLLATIYPWGRFICVTRDVRDTAVSSWFHRKLLGETIPYATIDEFALAFAHDVWAPMMWLARRSARALGPHRYLEVAYEDYKARPAEQVERLLGFLGLPAEPDYVGACVSDADFRRQGGREPGIERASFFRKGAVGDWHNHLSERAAEQTLRHAHEILAQPFEPGSTENALPSQTCAV